jgi:hypothetical protein
MNPPHLTRDQAELCLGYLSLGLRVKDVSKAMDVSEAVVRDVQRGRTYADAQPRELRMSIVIEEIKS